MKVLLQNKKVSLNYEILDTYTAGISLLGFEVKSLKNHQGSLEGSFVTLSSTDNKYTVTLRGLSIPPYQKANNPDNLQERTRVLLLQKKEIAAIERQMHTKGVTLVPKTIGLEGGKVKIEIAVVRGKKKHDKREDIKRRDQERDVLRETKTRFS